MLNPNEPRCQGATGFFVNGITQGVMPKDCCKCARRTDIVPGHSHVYMQAPTWLPWDGGCPKRVDPAPAVDVGVD